MPNLDSTRMDSGGEKFNLQPTQFEFWVYRFRLYWFWVHIGRFQVRWSGAKSGKILFEILSDLVGSNKILLIFTYIYKYRAEILMDLAKIYLSDKLKGLDLPVFGRVYDFRRGKKSSSGRLGSSVSQTANPQLEPMVSSACVGDPRPTITKLWSGGFEWRWSGFGWFGRAGRVLDSPN